MSTLPDQTTHSLAALCQRPPPRDLERCRKSARAQPRFLLAGDPDLRAWLDVVRLPRVARRIYRRALRTRVPRMRRAGRTVLL